MAGRIVVVTGGGTGIGRAIAAAFAARGDTVVIVGRRERVLAETAAELSAQSSGAIAWRTCDVAAPEQVEETVAWLRAHVSDVGDVLVTNAGGAGSLGPGASLHEAAAYARRTVDTNLIGTYLMLHALHPWLRRPGGRIITVSSIAAFRGGGDMYSAAKAGVVGLTYALAQELGPQGITVNAVAPGLVLDTQFFGDRMTEERKQRAVAQTPMGRAGRPADIAAAVQYLASPEASFVTGEVLHVNGGWLFGR
ncbi:MAG TPA: SDR family oxidoreductase [bacterium]|nr:SDR family oxidoreductase [bacterium]